MLFYRHSINTPIHTHTPHTYTYARAHTDEHRMLLETSCGASLAALNGDLIADLQRSRRLRNEINTVVVIVCGGNVVDLAEMERLRIMFNL